ncbi:DNA cytosine methyltransferase [Sphingobium chungbukense]|uniref:DNA cytosine methyltransferase n=1 Tax=Sphingobium chungbukense TaxID=56193 RepID=UPI00069A344F|nr:DNA cytosine methyltransferase [Sphingobium chungbukense]
MLNMQAWRNGASVCSLSQILETGPIPSRYYLSAKACLGIIRRAAKRGKELPALLAHALKAVAALEPISNAKVDCSQSDSGGGRTSGPIDVAACLTAKGQRVDFEVETFIADVAGTLPAGGNETGGDRQPGTSADTAGSMLVAHTLRAEGFDASEDGTGRGTPIVPVPFSIMPMNSGKDYKARAVDVAQPLMAGGPVGGNQGGDYIVDQAPVAFSCKDYGADAQDDLSPTLRAMGHADSHANAGGQMAVAIQAGALRENPASGPDGAGFKEGVAYTLEARAEVQAVATEWAVRRLTVTECCRLQGYPDDWTMIEHGSRRTIDDDEAAYLTAKGAHVVRDNEGRWRTNAAADGPQYKALGNAWAVACVRPVVLRIMEGQTA